jgi:hypothetical protein
MLSTLDVLERLRLFVLLNPVSVVAVASSILDVLGGSRLFRTFDSSLCCCRSFVRRRARDVRCSGSTHAD